MSSSACLDPGNQSKVFTDDPWLKTRDMSGVLLDRKASGKQVHKTAVSQSLPKCWPE